MTPATPRSSTRERRVALQRLLATERIATQDLLARRMKKLGFDVTQATLSRDLAALRARRAALAEGGTVYELPDPVPSRAAEPRPLAGDELAAVSPLVVNVDHSVALVVVATTPGGASAVARAIDHARAPGILGTIAGDDTIFIAPARDRSPAQLATQLQSLWRSR